MKAVTIVFKNPIIWIFILALIIRLYRLGELPYGFHVDEVKVAWNSYSFFKTGQTEQLKPLGLYYNTFGDFRPTGIFYLTSLFTGLFGKTEFFTRFPTALFGALTVFPIYFFVRSFFSIKFNKINTQIGLYTATFLAINPWHIYLSRATNEVVISTFFVISALFFLIRNVASRNYVYLLLYSISLISSYLFYHPIRFLGPLFVIATIIFFKPKEQRYLKANLMIATCLPLLLSIFLSTTPEARARFSQVSIFKNVDTLYEIDRVSKENKSSLVLVRIFDNKYVIYAKEFINEYGKYFSARFLIGDSARPYRFTSPGMGLLTYIEAVFLITGLARLIQRKIPILIFILLALAPIPAAMTAEDAPNLSRSFQMLPFLLTIEAYGYYSLINRIQIRKGFVFVLELLILVNFIYFSHIYLNHSMSHRPYLKDYVGDTPTYRNVGTKELSLLLDNLSTKYDKVIVTNYPDTPFEWYAFFNNYDPSDINQTYRKETNERVYKNKTFPNLDTINQRIVTIGLYS